MTIKQLGPEDSLFEATYLGEAYSKSLGFGRFSIEVFLSYYHDLIVSARGAVFAAYVERELAGGMAAGIFTDPHTGVKTAQMMFLYLQPQFEAYGGHLLRRYRSWAIKNDCRRLLAESLEGYRSDQMDRLLRIMDFHPIARTYELKVA